MDIEVIPPNSISSPPKNNMAPAQDDGPVNLLCGAHINECRTGCFVMRKIIAHMFGRNRVCTSQIPEHCWVQWCRKHYQRLRHRMLEQGWIFLQINCLKSQLGRMEAWGGVQSFTINLQHRFQEELNREGPAQIHADEAAVVNSPDTTTKTKDCLTKKNIKESLNCFLYPLLGADKSFQEVYAVIDAVEKAANEGQITLLPPLQFLPRIDATLHPPPPIARPRKKRKTRALKNQAHDNNESDSETLVGSDNAKSNGSSTSQHSSPALKPLSSLTKKRVAVKPFQPSLMTTGAQVATIPDTKIQYGVNYDDGDAAALTIIPNGTDSEVASDNPSLTAQPSSSLNNTKNRLVVETGSFVTSPTPEKRVDDEVFENEVQDPALDKDRVSAAVTVEVIAKNKKSETSSDKLREVQISASWKQGPATKQRSGENGPVGSRVEKSRSFRGAPIPLAPLQKIQAPPPGSIPIIDKEYGLVGYKTPKPKSDKAAPSSARRPHFDLHNTSHHATAAEPAEPLIENSLIQFSSYPKDITRTYRSIPQEPNGEILAPATNERKDSAMETMHRKRKFSGEMLGAEIDGEDADAPVHHTGYPIASMAKTKFNDRTSLVMSVESTINTDTPAYHIGYRLTSMEKARVNAPSATTPRAMSVENTINANPLAHHRIGYRIAPREKKKYNGWTPANAPTMITTHVMSVDSTMNTDNITTNPQRDLSPELDGGSSTNSSSPA